MPMRRLARYLLTLCSALSLLLCAAACVLWVRSYWLADLVTSRRLDGGWSVQSARGRVTLGVERSDRSGWPAEWYGVKYIRAKDPSVYDTGVAGLGALNVDAGDTFELWERWGLGWGKWQGRGNGPMIAMAIVPLWCVAAVTAVLPLGWTTLGWRSRVRARRRQRTGLCAGCGYDLRASPKRCPECGAARV
jgi:hypothetical protein